MMLRRVIAIAAAAGAALLVPAGVVSAHDHSITATCEGISVEMFNYSAEPPNVNTVQIWVDGAVAVPPTTFGATFSWSMSFDDVTIHHSYRVAVTSTMFPEASFDTGVQHIEACAAPTTSTTTTLAAVPPSTTDPTTTTTLAAPASSVSATTTTTTVASAAGSASTTTLVAPAVASRPPAPQSDVAAASGTLPSTGADNGYMALGALGAVLVGGLLMAIALRSRPGS